VSGKSVSNKLNRVELDLTARPVDRTADEANRLLGAVNALEPSGLDGYQVRLLDGNALGGTERRLLALRPFGDCPLPGNVLVVKEPEPPLVRHGFQTPDGHAQKRRRPKVIAVVAADDLGVADRNFCTHQFLLAIDARQAVFVIRRHGTVAGRHPGKGRRGGERRRRGRERSSETHREGVVKRFRCIQVEWPEPMRDGDREIDLLTDLPATVRAGQIAELSRRRWTIERRLGELSGTLSKEPRSWCQPPGFRFVFAFGLVASTAVQVFKAAVRAVHSSAPWACRGPTGRASRRKRGCRGCLRW
jgi:hypothetical protein